MGSVTWRIALVCVLVSITMGLGLPILHAQEPVSPSPVGMESGTGTTAAPAKVDSGDTAWVLMSSALVLAMTAPGLALFYAGMVRSKNALNTIMQCFMVAGLVSLQWVLWGYTLAFGPDVRHVIGSLDWWGLHGVGLDPNADYAATVPHQAFMVFQMMFAIITPSLITGAFVERMKFSAFLVFILLWTTLVYDPLAHWVWGVGGWLRNLGALDFAGGTVVHISSGVAGLACALVFGKRHGHGRDIMAPHNLPFTVLGASLLWFGWFGFNAGSALSAGAIATVAFVATNTATAAGIVAWTAAEWVYRGKPTVLGACSGAVAGLVAITPASGFVSPLSSIWIGLGAGGICYLAVVLKERFGYDDALDAFGIHGVGGTWGALATGLFASKAINPAGADGLFFGNAWQFGIQLLSVLIAWGLSFGATYLLLKAIDAVMGLRVSREEEVTGLDLTQHSEAAYSSPR